MKDYQILKNGIEYIENHISEEIRVKDIADACNFSLYHFIRVFSTMTFYSPKEYVIKRKITEAANQLRQSQDTVLEIAMSYGFNNHETFSRAFKRVVGMNPTDYRKSEMIIHLTPKLDLGYLEYTHEYGLIQPKKIEYSGESYCGFSHLKNEKTISLEEVSMYFDTCCPIYITETTFDDRVLYFYGQKREYLRTRINYNIPDGLYAEFGPVKENDMIYLKRYIMDVWFQNSGYFYGGVMIYKVVLKDQCGYSILIRVEQKTSK